MSILETKNISKIYDEIKVPVTALKDINLNIEKGEFTAIVGPSGSGKTTLLNILGGLDKPSTGTVCIDKINITNLKSNELINFRLLNIGFIFQAYNLIPVLTSLENVEFIMLLQNKPKIERQKRAKELLDLVGLNDKIDNKPSELSGGQQQRVAVARALASNPAFILADEPTANLDSKTAENLLNIMYKINREYQSTFIFSTHDQRVINHAKRVITLVDGTISNDEIR